MKRGLVGLMLSLVLAVSVWSATPKTDLQFHHELEKATLAVYERFPTVKVPETQEDAFFRELMGVPAQKDFTERFICTATVVGRQDDDYMLLSAGHCFTSTRPNLKYYISEGVSDDPVLQHVDIVKSVSNDKYDFALLHLRSPRDYPVMVVSADPLPPVETPLVNVNFSFGMVQQLVKGFIGTGIMKKGEGDQDCHMCAGRYIAELGVAPGASGSAIVDETTRKIIGVTEGIFPGYTVGTIVIPTGQTLDDFMVDDAIMEKLPPVPVAKPKPIQPQVAPPLVSNRVFLVLGLSLFAVWLLAILVTGYVNGRSRKHPEWR